MDYFIGVDVSKRSLDLAVVRDGLVVQQELQWNQHSVTKQQQLLSYYSRKKRFPSK